MTKKKLIFIKLGGSLITDKKRPYQVRNKTIESLAKSIRRVVQELPHCRFIIGNGAGSFGHYAATQYDHRTPFGFAFIQQKVKVLNSILVDALLENDVASISFPFSAISTANKSVVEKAFIDSLVGCLGNGMAPVVYGDVVYDSEQVSSIFSTEKIFSILIDRLGDQYEIERVIHLTNVDGFLDGRNIVVPRITNANYDLVKKHLYKTNGYDVTGGMFHKVEESMALAQKGIITNIANGEIDGVLERILLKNEKIGTEISSK